MAVGAPAWAAAMRAHNYARALAYYRKAYAVAANQEDASYGIAMALEDTGDLRGAERFCDDGTRCHLEDDQPYWAFRHAEVIADLNRPSEAAAEYNAGVHAMLSDRSGMHSGYGLPNVAAPGRGNAVSMPTFLALCELGLAVGRTDLALEQGDLGPAAHLDKALKFDRSSNFVKYVHMVRVYGSPRDLIILARS